MIRFIATLSIGLGACLTSGDVRAAVSLPDDQPVLTLAAKGVQIYECRASTAGSLAWTFREPRADLFANGRKVGRHYAGPTWEHEDGSRIIGKLVDQQTAPEADAIPWLRLSVASRSGEGALSAAAVVLRVDTHGGKLSGACDRSGAVSEVPYTADYILVASPK